MNDVFLPKLVVQIGGKVSVRDEDGERMSSLFLVVDWQMLKSLHYC